MFLQHDRLEDVAPADVVRVAQAYFKASNLTVGYYIPDAAPDRTVVPATPNLESLLGNYKSTRDHRACRGVRSDAGQHREPVVASQARQRHEGRDSAQEDREQHGDGDDRAALRRRQTLSKGQNAAAHFAGALIMRGGTKKHTRAADSGRMRKLNATVTVGGGGGGGGRGGRGGGEAVAEAERSPASTPASRRPRTISSPRCAWRRRS